MVNPHHDIEPMERIPAEWYETLEKFLLSGDPADLSVEMLQHEVTEEELATYQALNKNRFSLSREGQKEVNRIILKTRDAARKAGKRLDPFKQW